MPSTLILVSIVLSAALAAIVLGLWRWAYVVAAPDEWLLLIRDGRLLQAGVGIAVWRRPGDVVARFSSTLQRVGFQLEALTAERIRVAVEGFMFWSVATDGDGPFRAYRSLGLANLLSPPPDLKHPKHLLTPAQHRAMQQIVAATAQQQLATVSLVELLHGQEALGAALMARLRAHLEPLGAAVSQLQILSARPAEAALLRDLSARDEERIREEAGQARLEAGERVRRRELEARTRQQQEEAAARREVIESEHTLKRRQEELARAEALLAEDRALAVAEAHQRIDEAKLAFEATRSRRLAEAARDAALLRLEAEEKKSAAVRAHELGRLSAEKLAEAVQIKDGRWISVGESPMAAVAGVLTALREHMKAS